MSNQTVKEQFNKQAENFANWWIGKHVEYIKAYFNFCGIQPADNVLDVACGPGEFTLYIAQRVSHAHGVDISDVEIKMAKELVRKFGLKNVDFDCADVEKLPYPDNLYSVVLSKSAFHHFTQPGIVFKEMIRCCQTEGKISIQDIVAYEDDYINDFFETFDKLVDISHHKTLSEAKFNQLYIDNKIEKLADFRLEVDLNVSEYLSHARQNEENKLKIQNLLEKAEEDHKLNDFLFRKDDELFFKRPVYLILGRKGKFIPLNS
jgi:ubiquinone/menaquinone biosynthesis C-methylase UbiE